MKFSIKDNKIYDLPISNGVEKIKTEFAILRFPYGRTVDFGCICYLSREPTQKHNNKNRKRLGGRRVNLKSLNQERVEQVRTLIQYVSDCLANSGRREETIRDSASRFIAFICWADEHGFHNVLRSADDARAVLIQYLMHIRERVNTNSLSIKGGIRQQFAVIRFLSDLFNADIARGINILRHPARKTSGTVPPSEDAQSKVLGLCEILFDSLSSFIINKEQYPFYFDVPSSFGYTDNKLWVFPSTSWFKSPGTLNANSQIGCFDYSKGKLFTANELLSAADMEVNNRRYIRNRIKRGERQISAANSNFHHPQRLSLGMVAVNAFVILFVAQTGMNWAQIVDQTWAEDYEIGATSQLFRSIKWRAGHQVTFELPVGFMPRFKRYLELRDFLLAGKSCDFLFFKLGNKGRGAPAKVKCGPGYTFDTLQRIDPSLPKVMPRQWRAAKSDWLIRNTDPAVAAMVLQNSEKTVLASYAAGSETVHLEEMSVFLNKVSECVLAGGIVVEGGVVRPVGLCSRYGAPNLRFGEPPIQLDCRGAEGCLFCDKHIVHADEVDVRKLISCRFYLQKTEPMMLSHEKSQILLTPILNRINKILDEVSRLDVDLVKKVTREVEIEGELDLYWAGKLEILMELGAVV